MANQGLPSSFNSTNYARIGHASQQLLPTILQELLLIKEPPSLLQGHVINNTFLNSTLRPEEWLLINNVTTKGYADFDIPLSYKIIRNLNIVQSPTSGWHNQSGPISTEITVGDDIERIRRIRNGIIHRGNANVTDGELNDYFYKLKEIAARLEMYLGKQNGEFVSKLDHLKSCCMDSEIANMYIRKLEELKDRERELEDIIGRTITKFEDEFNVVHGELSDVDQHISIVDARLSGVDERVLGIEQRVTDEFTEVHGDVNRIGQHVSRVDEQVLSVDRQVSTINENIGRLLSTETETGITILLKSKLFVIENHSTSIIRMFWADDLIYRKQEDKTISQI